MLFIKVDVGLDYKSPVVHKTFTGHEISLSLSVATENFGDADTA